MRLTWRDGWNSPLRPFYLCLLITAVIWIVEWGMYFLSPHLQHAGAASFLSPMEQAFFRYGDLTTFLPRSAEFGHPGMLTRTDLSSPFPYPLPAVFVFLPFAKLTHHPVLWYLSCAWLVLLSITAIFACKIYRLRPSSKIQGLVWCTFLLLHPMWFLLDRANIEVFLWGAIVLAVILFVKRRHASAAVLFGLAASMKIYPALLFLLFFRKRDIRALLLAVGTVLMVTAWTYHLAGPTIAQAMRDMQGSAAYLNATQVGVVQERILRWDHSIFGLLKQIYFVVRNQTDGVSQEAISFRNWTRPFGILAGIAFVVLYWFRIRLLPFPNEIISLLLIAILFPFVSYEYTLMYVWPIFLTLLIYALSVPNRDIPLLKGGRGTLVGALFGILFSPLTNLAFKHGAGQVKCVCLLMFLGLVLRYPLPTGILDWSGTPQKHSNEEQIAAASTA